MHLPKSGIDSYDPNFIRNKTGFESSFLGEIVLVPLTEGRKENPVRMSVYIIPAVMEGGSPAGKITGIMTLCQLFFIGQFSNVPRFRMDQNLTGFRFAEP